MLAEVGMLPEEPVVLGRDLEPLAPEANGVDAGC